MQIAYLMFLLKFSYGRINKYQFFDNICNVYLQFQLIACFYVFLNLRPVGVDIYPAQEWLDIG